MDSLVKGGFGLLNFIMFRAFAMEVAHFLFDHSWVDSISPRRIKLARDFVEHSVIEDRQKFSLGRLHSGNGPRDHL